MDIVANTAAKSGIQVDRHGKAIMDFLLTSGAGQSLPVVSAMTGVPYQKVATLTRVLEAHGLVVRARDYTDTRILVVSVAEGVTRDSYHA